MIVGHWTPPRDVQKPEISRCSSGPALWLMRCAGVVGMLPVLPKEGDARRLLGLLQRAGYDDLDGLGTIGV
jgi:hypothetical protein